MIKEFQGEHRWLSNFWPVPVVREGITYKSVEHGYMSAKSDDESWKEFCRITESPGQVKRASKELEKKGLLVKDWEDAKQHVMYDLLVQKYNQEPFKTQLKETGDIEIQEGNWHKDAYWGIRFDTGEGKNILGKMIMKIRKTL